jgi:hypothetical protein
MGVSGHSGSPQTGTQPLPVGKIDETLVRTPGECWELQSSKKLAFFKGKMSVS